MPTTPVPLRLIGLVSLVVVLVGTFLPWLRSGDVTRNSYRTAGLIERLIALDGGGRALLDAWPFLGLAGAALVGAFVTGARRSAVIGLTLLSVVAGAVAYGTLLLPGSQGVSVAQPGPATTLAGASGFLLCTLSGLILTRNRASAGRGAVPHQPRSSNGADR